MYYFNAALESNIVAGNNYLSNGIKPLPETM